MQYPQLAAREGWSPFRARLAVVLALVPAVFLVGATRGRPALADSGTSLDSLYRQVPASAVLDAGDNWIAEPAGSALRPPAGSTPIVTPVSTATTGLSTVRTGVNMAGGKLLAGASALSFMAMGYQIGNLGLDFVWKDRPGNYTGPLPNADVAIGPGPGWDTGIFTLTNSTLAVTTTETLGAVNTTPTPVTFPWQHTPVNTDPQQRVNYGSVTYVTYQFMVQCTYPNTTTAGPPGTYWLAGGNGSGNWDGTQGTSNSTKTFAPTCPYTLANGVDRPKASQIRLYAKPGSGQTLSTAAGSPDLKSTWDPERQQNDPDPLRQYVPKRECVKRADPTQLVVLTGTPVETHQSAGGLPAFTFPPCPAGYITNGTAVTQQTKNPDGTLAGSPSVVYGKGTGAQQTLTTYPQCQTQVCLLELTRIMPDGTRVPWSEAALEAGLFDDFATAVASGTSSPDFECKYGGTVVALAECRLIPTKLLVPPTADEDNCDASDFSLNPVSWVVVPLKCLFIPRQQVVNDATTRLSEAWGASAPGVVSDAVGSVFGPVVNLGDDQGQADCNGPPFTIPQLPAMHSPLTLHPLSTCNELTQYLLGIYMPLATAFIYLGGFFAGTRLLLKTVDADHGVSA